MSTSIQFDTLIRQASLGSFGISSESFHSQKRSQLFHRHEWHSRFWFEGYNSLDLAQLSCQYSTLFEKVYTTQKYLKSAFYLRPFLIRPKRFPSLLLPPFTPFLSSPLPSIPSPALTFRSLVSTRYYSKNHPRSDIVKLLPFCQP